MDQFFSTSLSAFAWIVNPNDIMLQSLDIMINHKRNPPNSNNSSSNNKNSNADDILLLVNELKFENWDLRVL